MRQAIFPHRRKTTWLLLAAGLLTAPPAVAQAGRPGTAPALREARAAFVSGGRRITVESWEPAQGGRYPAVLLVHGLDGAGRKDDVYRSVAGRLARKGYVVLLVHYFDRTGTDGKQAQALVAEFRRCWDRRAGSAAEARKVGGLFRDWQQTLRDGVRHARSLPGVQKDQVALVGCSMGAFLALAVAAEEETGVTAVVDLFGGLPPTARPRRLPPTLILHGDRDRVVPVACAHALRDWFRKHNRPHEMKVYAGVGHVFVREGGELDWLAAWDAECRTHAFLRRHLTGKAAPASVLAAR